MSDQGGVKDPQVDTKDSHDDQAPIVAKKDVVDEASPSIIQESIKEDVGE